MRRAIALGARTLLVLVPVATGCGSTAPTPTVPTPDFSPDATLEVTDSSPLTVDIAAGGTDLGSGSVLLCRHCCWTRQGRRG